MVLTSPSQPRIGRGRPAHSATLPDAIERWRHAVFGGDRGRRTVHTLSPAGGRKQRLSRRARMRRGLSRSTWAAPARHRLHRSGAPLEVTRGDRTPAGRRARTRYDHDLRRGGSIAWIDGGASSMSGRRRGADPVRPAMDAAGFRPTVTDPISCAAISTRTISSAARRSLASRGARSAQATSAIPCR